MPFHPDPKPSVVSFFVVLEASLLIGLGIWLGAAGATSARGEGLMQMTVPQTHIRLQGEMGRRVEATVDQWLLPTWDANPAIIEMFRLRDRNPAYDQPVPWAGEFAGKYLISLVQMRKMTDNVKLDELLRRVVPELISTQATDGYLGPFRSNDRLLGHWDLWGHYHVMLGLYMDYKETGSREALDAAKRAADLCCQIYLDSGRHISDAGDYEMNMAIIHVLGMLYRETGNARYEQLMQAIKTEWERPGAGDYYRQALKGVEFYRTPRPRWESLHDLQGLGELYRISGDESYKQALLHYWHSIQRTDIHNSGSFSTGEGAVGNPFLPGAIETCCTVAWIALSIDALTLSGDSKIADAIELATWNAVLGYQHPSGRWVTYNTPMNGKRLASAHEIVFQARAGSPELNCCSVNGPRGLGMIAEWAVLTRGDGLCLNYYGPGTMTLKDAGGTTWTLTQTTQYPAAGTIKIQVDPVRPTTATLSLRIPEWSRQTSVAVNGANASGVTPGTYLELRRQWNPGDRIELELDMSPRVLRGDENVQYQTSLYLGPLLLAFDQAHNAFEFDQFPELDLSKLDGQSVTPSTRIKPLVLYQFTGADGRKVNLCDFATAGALGTVYQSWLPVKNVAPGSFYLQRPAKGAALPVGPIPFTWGNAGPGASYELMIAEDAQMSVGVIRKSALTSNACTLNQALEAKKNYYWQVEARNAAGQTISRNGPWVFSIDPGLVVIKDGLLLRAALDGSGKPEVGALLEESATAPARDRLAAEGKALGFNGTTAKLRYAAQGGFPVEDYTFLGWFQPKGMSPNDGALHQIFSAWAKPWDDPLRLTIMGTTLKAEVESGIAYATPGIILENERWYHVAAVKAGNQLRLYLDGELKQQVSVPAVLSTQAEDFGIGFNPHYQNGETFFGALDSIAFYNKALTGDEVKKSFSASGSQTGVQLGAHEYIQATPVRWSASDSGPETLLAGSGDPWM